MVRILSLGRCVAYSRWGVHRFATCQVYNRHATEDRHANEQVKDDEGEKRQVASTLTNASVRPQFSNPPNNRKGFSLEKPREAFLNLVGTTGFEPATSRTPSVRATRLRHVPSKLFQYDPKKFVVKSADQPTVQFDCGTRILRVIHGRDTNAT